MKRVMRTGLLAAVCLAVGTTAIGAQPGWALACGDGRIDRVLDAMESALPWTLCCSENDAADVTLQTAAGCSGQALSIGYDLHGPHPAGADWFLIRRTFSSLQDVSAGTHLRFAIRSANANAHHNLQIKLVDASGRIDWHVIESATDIPAWRTIYVDLRSLVCFTDCVSRPPLDLTRIVELQIAVGRCLRDVGGSDIECDSGTQDTSTLVIDEMALVDLKPGAAHRLANSEPETITQSPAVRAAAAAVLRDRQVVMGMAPAWYPEILANYNTYAQAVRLLVLLEELRLTQDQSFRSASEQALLTMLTLQRPVGAPHAGAWFTAYQRSGDMFVPRDGCTGNEILEHEIDRCLWVGNTAWMMIALRKAINGGVGDATTLQAALDRAATWILGLRGRIQGFPDVVTFGLEGNISAYFGLLSADRASEAKRLGNAVFTHGWDPVEQRMKIGVLPHDLDTALDTAGSWGTDLLRCLGKETEARSSQAYVASMFRTTSFDGSLDGYGDVRGPWTMTVEFGAQAVVSRMPGSQHAIGQIQLLQGVDGSFPGSTDDFSGGGAWTTTWQGVAPTAWVYFAHASNPLGSCPVVALRILPS